jgi:hypothetical protein
MSYNNQILITNLPKLDLKINTEGANLYNIFFFKILFNYNFLSSDFSFYKFFKIKNATSLNLKDTDNKKHFLILNNYESLKNTDNNALRFLFSSFFFKKNKIVFFSGFNN